MGRCSPASRNSCKSSIHRFAVAFLTENPARAWVLGCMLGSAFLGDHPKPEALLMWIMSEYQELLKPGGKVYSNDDFEKQIRKSEKVPHRSAVNRSFIL